MKVLELFAGYRSIGKAFENRGHEVFSIDNDPNLPDIDWCVDINTITGKDILERFGRPDVIWLSPECCTYTISAIGYHRDGLAEDELRPKSRKAMEHDTLTQNAIELIYELKPKFYFIENPLGALRKMLWMQDYPRYTLTYCQYGDFRRKETDIWTNHPNPKFKPPCRNGDPCHVPAPRGSLTGTQGMSKEEISKIPKELCEHIVNICEEYINEDVKLEGFIS